MLDKHIANSVELNLTLRTLNHTQIIISEESKRIHTTFPVEVGPTFMHLGRMCLN
jgi:hypothetical protein